MDNNGILKNRAYLYITEFFSGVAVMAVELGASRLLAPYFSSSQIVWTIIIGTIMIAMALGNVYGGRSADRDPNPDRLYKRMLLASVWIAAIPFAGRYVILAVSALLIVAVNTNFLVVAAFVSCMVIFVFPLFLLGTVTPSLVKYTVASLNESGRTVGTLGAFNTVGSIIGTFLPTFVTIPAVGTSVTFLIFGGILLVIAGIYFVSSEKKTAGLLISAILYALCVFMNRYTGFAFWEDSLLYEGESVYNYLQVKENEEEVLLSTNVLFGVQSVKRKDGALSGMYYDYAMAAPVISGVKNREKTDVLILGMGTGTYASQCEKFFPGVNIEGVEIDGKITALAKKYFDASDTVPVVTYDGRAYLQAVDKKYDVIMVDAYQDISIPFQMSSVEFFKLVYDHLNDDGVMVVNMNMRSDVSGNINEYLNDTIASVFCSVATLDVPRYTNRELFAVKQGKVRDRLYENAKDMSDTELTELMVDTYAYLNDYETHGHMLTDDKAPVELLGMKEIDGLIKREVAFYRDIYETEGLNGVMNALGI